MAVRVRVVAVLVGCSALLAACGDAAPGPGPSPGPTLSSSTGGRPSPTPGGQASATPTEEGTVDPDVRPIVDAATADLTGRAVTATGPVRVILARTETFPDAALGCPRPGEDYAQGPVEGYRVLLGRGERAWLYTAGPDGVPHLCPSQEKDGGREFVPPPGARR